MRKSISTAFFSMVSTLMVLGIVLMGRSEWVLFKSYFVLRDVQRAKARPLMVCRPSGSTMDVRERQS